MPTYCHLRRKLVLVQREDVVDSEELALLRVVALNTLEVPTLVVQYHRACLSCRFNTFLVCTLAS